MTFGLVIKLSVGLALFAAIIFAVLMKGDDNDEQEPHNQCDMDCACCDQCICDACISNDD